MTVIDKIRINIFGNAAKLSVSTAEVKDIEFLETEAGKRGETLATALFDPSFLPSLGLLNKAGESIKSWSDLNDPIWINAVLCDHRSFLEIKVNGAKKLKTALSGILAENVLFPLFNTRLEEIREEDTGPAIFCIEVFSGHVATAQWEVAEFSLDDLEFDVIRVIIPPFPELTLLRELRFKGKFVPFLTKSVVVTGQHAWIKK